VLLFYRQKAAIQCCQQHALLLVINNRQCSHIGFLHIFFKLSLRRANVVRILTGGESVSPRNGVADETL
jgi:hypothetical protein